jgi:hypothetical protein
MHEIIREGSSFDMKEPFRADTCIHYERCLSNAAYKNISLDCTACRYRQDDLDPPEAENLSAYCRLLAAVFFPERYGHYILSEPDTA